MQFKMWEEPDLSTDEFATDQMEQRERTVTRYKSRNSNISVYREHDFFIVTNNPSFDPFIRAN